MNMSDYRDALMFEMEHPVLCAILRLVGWCVLLVMGAIILKMVLFW
jgi:hypothetical protein